MSSDMSEDNERCKSLIVRSVPFSGVRSAPVCVNSHNLTREISVEEDARLSRQVPVDPDRIEEIFWMLFNASPFANASEQDRARIVLCRLLLGPVSVPCFCEEWDVDEYMARCDYQCNGPVLYVHRERCRCDAVSNTVDGRSFRFSVMHGHGASHVFRGLLSLSEWNEHLPSVFCKCTTFKSDRYVMAVLPEHYSIFLVHYPYILRHICRFLTVPEIDDCTNAMISHLGQHLAVRINTHYRILFGNLNRPRASSLAAEANKKMFLMELQRLWLSVNYSNDVTRDFFEAILGLFHCDYGSVLSALRISGDVSPSLSSFSISQFKKQVLYFELDVQYGKSKKGVGENGFVYRRLSVTFSRADVIWRNMFVIYYSSSLDRSVGRRVFGNVKLLQGPRDPDRRKDKIDVNARRYVCIVNRLAMTHYRERDGVYRRSRQRYKTLFDFSGPDLLRRYRSGFMCLGHDGRRKQENRSVLGGMEFSEITTVTVGEITVNAFNTNRVINLKASLCSRDRSGLGRSPRNMTHSFVMYKHTFKEPPCTVSTFVSNDAAHTNSLNVNIRGSYLEFLYALSVYRLYVDIENFFLPASVCNSNSSLDIHGLEDQSVIRSGRNKVYWTTNFPCMISTTDSINVGWFKAATAIIPKVSGVALENILLKEVAHIRSMDNVKIDHGLHNMFTLMETRNAYQVPFLSKQFVLFLRAALINVCGCEQRELIDGFMLQIIKDGLFDYHKDIAAHTKIKHTCALVGTRLANNVPKIIVKNKKIKLDNPGRNANILTLCKQMEPARVDPVRLKVLADILRTSAEVSSNERTKQVIGETECRLRTAAKRCGAYKV